MVALCFGRLGVGLGLACGWVWLSGCCGEGGGVGCVCFVVQHLDCEAS